MSDKKVAWIIEDVINKKDTDRLVEACKNSATPYSVLSTKDILLKDGSGNLYDHHPVIAYGSMNFMNAIHKTSLLPGSWLDYDATQCHKYLSILGKYSIHNLCGIYGFHTLAQLIQYEREIFSLYHDNSSGPFADELFIKPNVSNKAFSGQVISNGNKFTEFLSSVIHLDDSILCLIATPLDKEAYKIKYELRFFCTSKMIITWSQYQPEVSNGNSIVNEYNLIDYVDIIREKYFQSASLKFPYEHIITIDIAVIVQKSSPSRVIPKLVEIGGFNCAGLYDINYDLLVKEANRCALQEWKEYESTN